MEFHVFTFPSIIAASMLALEARRLPFHVPVHDEPWTTSPVVNMARRIEPT